MIKKLANFIFLFLLCSCGPSISDTNGRDYKDYEEFQISNIEDFYLQEEDEYLVEIYFPECPHCTNIKGNIFDYLDNYKNNKVSKKLYLFNIKSGSSEEGRTNREKFKKKPSNSFDENQAKIWLNQNLNEKPNKIEDTYFFYVPSLYQIKNGVLDYVTWGENNVINYLN